MEGGSTESSKPTHTPVATCTKTTAKCQTFLVQQFSIINSTETTIQVEQHQNISVTEPPTNVELSEVTQNASADKPAIPVKEPKPRRSLEKKRPRLVKKFVPVPIPNGPVHLSNDLLHPEVTTEELEQVDATPRSPEDVYDYIQTQFTSLFSQARAAFPAHKSDCVSLFCKFISAHRDYAHLEELVADAEAKNSQLRDTYVHSRPFDPSVQVSQSYQPIDPEKEAMRLKKDIKLAEVKLAKLREEESDQPTLVQHKTGLNGTIDNDTIQMSVAITRMREANSRMQGEVDSLEQKLSAMEKRVSLMTQKKSAYSPRLGKKKINVYC